MNISAGVSPRCQLSGHCQRGAGHISTIASYCGASLYSVTVMLQHERMNRCKIHPRILLFVVDNFIHKHKNILYILEKIYYLSIFLPCISYYINLNSTTDGLNGYMLPRKPSLYIHKNIAIHYSHFFQILFK